MDFHGQILARSGGGSSVKVRLVRTGTVTDLEASAAARPGCHYLVTGLIFLLPLGASLFVRSLISQVRDLAAFVYHSP